MKTANTRLAAVLLALVMILTVLPVAGFAEEENTDMTEETTAATPAQTTEETSEEETETSTVTEDPTEEVTTAPTEEATDPAETGVFAAAGFAPRMVEVPMDIGGISDVDLSQDHNSTECVSHGHTPTGWSWNAESETLTLDGYNGGGIMIGSSAADDVTIILNNNSTVDGTVNGIDSVGSLTFKGSGVLNVTGAQDGISVTQEAIVIESGTINATGNAGAGFATSNGVFISGGNVTAKGGEHGINVQFDVQVNGGSLTVGDSATNGNVQGNLIVTDENAVVTVNGSVDGSLTVSDGTVTIDGTVGGAKIVTGGTVTVAGKTVEPGEDVIIIPAPITGIVAPVTGATPSYAINDGTNYDANLMFWFDSATSEVIYDDFAAGKVYTALVQLTAADGYVFDKNYASPSDVEGFLPVGADSIGISDSDASGEWLNLIITYTAAAAGGGGNPPPPPPVDPDPVDPDPVDPPSGSGSSDNGDDDDDDDRRSSSGGGSSSAPAATINTPAAPVTTAKATDAANAAVAAAQNSGSTTATANLKNPGDISLAALKAMDEAADMPLKLQADSTVGNAVDVRITLDPALATEGLNLSASTTSNTAKKTAATFEKYFSNPVATVSFGQAGSFGQRVEVAAKLDLALMDTKRLFFYSYDPKTGVYKRIEQPEYRIDANGYLHFKTELAGEIVVSEGELEKR